MPDDNPWNREESVALIAAVVYHGIISLSTNVVPPRSDTIIRTAQAFEVYLDRSDSE